MDRGAWRSTVHRGAESQTKLKQCGMHRCFQKPKGVTNTSVTIMHISRFREPDALLYEGIREAGGPSLGSPGII